AWESELMGCKYINNMMGGGPKPITEKDLKQYKCRKDRFSFDEAIQKGQDW
ncbi:18113_t:CDS:1, partial [Gigaspora margarita]